MNRKKQSTRNSSGFTLAELVITVTILGILAAVALPKFSDLTERTQTERNIGNIHVIREAFMQYYFKQHMKGNPHFPDPPGGVDNLMTEEWASLPIPSNLTEVVTPASLFSDGKVPLNSNQSPFSYYVTVSTNTNGVPLHTMTLGDPDPDSPTYDVEFSFSL
ncbi:MAG: type II secretion system protein [Candidatus Neomarinimicrobiota bacterium]